MQVKDKKLLKQLFEDTSKLPPSKFNQLIDALWRDMLALYAEKTIAESHIEKLDPNSPNYDARYVRQKNTFSATASWLQANGFGNTLSGNFTQAYGFHNIVSSFLEIALGQYATDSEGNPTEWIPTDRLAALGNGTSDEERSLAFEVFKSGLFKFFNAVKIGKFAHGEADPEDGTMQFTLEKSLELFENEKWVQLKDKHYHHVQTNPSRVWEIAHNLDKYPSVSVTDNNGDEYVGDIKHIDTDTLIVTFTASLSGFADLN